METFDGANKKPFKSHGLLNKSQIKLASYIKANKDVTLQGTKRFMDKSGEYYLKNIQLQNRKTNPHSKKDNSLNNPQNLENCLNGNIGKIKKRANKIVTLLPDNSLTPIPKKEGINKLGMANGYGKKELNDAQRTAVFIRRLEYATSMKKQIEDGKNYKNNTKKIGLIQEWWKTMFKIIKLQKNMRGFLFRKKLMNNLEHQEKLLQFITEFENIHNYHVYKQFIDNLKRKRDYEKAKLMEKCEDFNEKLDNLEKLHNMKNLKNCFKKWKDEAKMKKKEDMENLAKRLNDILKTRKNKNNLNTLKTIKDTTKNEDDKLNEKIKQFKVKNAKDRFIKYLKKAHRLNKILSNVKDKIDNRMKKEVLDKLKDIRNKNKLLSKLRKWKDFNDEMKRRDKIIDKLKKYKENELKKKLEEEKNKFSISSGVNDFTLLSNKKEKQETPKKENEMVMTFHNDLNIEAKPAPKLVFETAGQNFSLMAPEKLEFENPEEKIQKSDFGKFLEQLDNLKKYMDNNKLKQYLDKWKEINEKRNILEKLKDRLNDLIKKRKEKEDKLKQILDKLQNKKDKNNLKEYLYRWRDAAKKIKKEDLDNLAKTLNDILTKAKKESDDQNKKEVLDKLKELNDIAKGLTILDNLFNKKPKKDAFETLKKNSGMSEGFRVLDKLFKKKNNENRKDFMDRLKKNEENQKALEDINNLLEKKLKQKFLNNLKKKSNNKEGLEKLDKVIRDNLGRKLLDELKKVRDISKGVEALDKLINDKLKEDTFKKLKTMQFVDILEKMKKKHYENKKIEKLKKLMNTLKKIAKDRKEKEDKLKSKRISRRNNSKRKRTKSKKNNEKQLLKKAFDIWRENSSFEQTRNVLKRIKKNRLEHNNLNNLNEAEKNDLLQKYKNKMLQVLLNIYQRQKHLLLKKYLDKWSKTKGVEVESEYEPPKYSKKPRFEDKKEFSDSETNSFKPTYYNPKKNLYTQKTAPYLKRYAKRPFKRSDEPKEDEDKNNIKKKDKDDFSDTSSNNESVLGNGEYLIQKKKIITQPRNYTSQSFFIDKNNPNSLSTGNYQVNTHNTNQLPMTMKGDFISLIEQNPKILAQKNPRIQVTNATCDLNQIINNENTEDEINSEEVNYEIDKLDKKFILDKNSKVLTKVIKNCDKDLYASQKPFKTKKDKWYSVSIPLNNDEAKWEFLNNIKGERDKNTLNKFELIQKEAEPIKEEKDENEAPYSKRTLRSDKKKNQNSKETTTYKLREMNYTQFYRSPMKSPRIDDEKLLIGNRIRKPWEKQNTQKSLLNNTSKFWPKGRNIERSRGKIEFDPKYRSIDYDKGYELSDSDE